MYEADRPPVPWKRHWIEQGSLSLVEIEDGFLKPPSDLRLRYSRGKVAPLKHLSTLAEIPCLILLGGSGVGKSRELRSLAESSAENTSVTSCYIDLKGRSDSAAIEKALRGQTGFLDWEAGRHELVLILDSLDECQRRVGEVGGIICDLLRPLIKDRPRLRLRLGCRSSEWGTTTERLFKDLFSHLSSTAKNSGLGIYHLERLTREQVAEAARHRGVDTNSFLAQVDRSQLGALASHPITLDMLLAECVKGQSLGDTRTSIYARGLRSLCEDRHQHERPSHQTDYETTPEQRFFLSARDAAMGALTDRYTFTISAEKAPPSPATTLTPDDLLGAAQPTGPIEANTRTLRETLLTGLFSSLAENVVTWAHRSYAEFLAAHHLNETLSVDQLVGVFCDTTTSTPRLYPQLEEVAAWLAELNQDFFDRLADSNAEVFLRCDPHLLTPRVRELLAASYLRRLEHDDAEAAGWLTEFPLEKLAHPALCDQLRPIILNPKRSWLLRRTALQIATVCNLAALAADCVPFLFSPETSDGIVSAIGDLLASAATPETRRALRERFLTFPAPSEEIIAQSFRTLWPDYLSGEELVRLLPPAAKWSKDGSLRHLGNYHIPQLARADQLPALLRWVHQQGESLNDYHDYWGGLAKQHIAAQALRNLDQPAARADFIALFAAQTHSSGPLLPRGDTERDTVGETAMRRLFCKSIVEESPELFAGWHQWCARENGLINSADLPWAVECLRAANDAQLRERWLNFVFMVFDETLPSVALIETVVDLLPQVSAMLAQRSSWPLEQYGYPHGEKTKYHREQEAKKRRAAEPPFPEIIQRLLSEFEAGNPASMRKLLLKLERYTPEASSDTAPQK